jgi:REP element-mobilizing transposase RayT
MARLRRLHVPGGIHYVILHSNEGREIFPEAADYESFSKLVERCVRRCRVQIYAFCWTAHEVHFAIQVSTVPLGRFVQRFAGQHARVINRKQARHGHLFQQRYWTARLEQPGDLPEVVRHIHLTPQRLALDDPENYPWSSHRTYLGFAKIPWVTTSPVFRVLESPGLHRRAAYRQYIQDEVDRRAALRARQANGTEIHAEESEFLQRLMPKRRRPRDPALLNSIIDSVATKLSVPREAMLSPSRRRTLSLARALVAWHATHNEVATLTEVARCFQRNPSTLCVGVERYRRVRRDLFEESIANLLHAPTPHSHPAAPPAPVEDALVSTGT